MKSIKELKNISGKKIIVRVDFNVPIENGKVMDDFKIKKAISTIEYLHKKEAILILISHLGKNKENSLKPVFERLKKYVPNVTFIGESILGYETTRVLSNLKKGDIVLLENLRSDEGEMKNSPSFARGLSRYAEIYVNEAFPESHRPYASIIGLPKHLPSYAGFQLLDEIENLSKIFEPKHPFLCILGGAKFETKIPLVKKFFREADNIFIGGAIANDFFRAKGYEVGKSLIDEDHLPASSVVKHKDLILPIDVEVSEGKNRHYTYADKVKASESIVDVGPESIKKLEELIEKAKIIIWNGPLGKYENGFGGGTEAVLKAVAKSNAYTVIGGGNIVEIVTKLKMENKFDFVSTGGGAALEFLTKETLPGIKALK